MNMRDQEASDHDLVRRSAGGDDGAFRELYRRHHRAIYAYAVHATGQTTVAEDVTQEVFLTIVGGRTSYDPAQGPLRLYLYGIARHAVQQHRRQALRVVPIESTEVGPRLPLEAIAVPGGQFTQVPQEQQLRQLHQAILALPDRYRDAVVLCHMHGLSYREAADALGCTPGTVASRLNRARVLLARKLALTICPT